MSEQVLPTPKAVKDMLADLLGRDVTVAPTSPFAPGEDGPATIAVYVEDSLRIGAIIAVDLPLSAYAAAAIGLVPVGGAEAAIEDKDLSGTLGENLYEVLNIAASLFNVEDAPHVRLYDMHLAGVPTPPQVLAQALVLGRREDLTVEVAGYGTGRFSMLLV